MIVTARDYCLEGKRAIGGLGVDGRIILKWTSGSRMGHMDWIDLAQDRNSWRELVNAVMNLRLSLIGGIS
jgi:hypothetical protein